MRLAALLGFLTAGCSFVVDGFDARLVDAAVAPTCADRAKNGSETDLDCGGGCAPCGDGSGCATGRDCTSTICSQGRCAAPTCSDAVQNGDESDVDCGGFACPKCGPGSKCRGVNDCLANATCAGTCSCDSGFFGATCALPVSCADLLAKNAGAMTGTTIIDPDGAGPGQPLPVYCDMTTAGGGWTRLVRHVATGGLFADDPSGRSSNTGDPGNDRYSILGLVDQFRHGDGSYEFLYWNRQGNKLVVSKQTWSPLDAATMGKCPAGNTIEMANYAISLFCGFTPGPTGTAVVNGYGPSWTHAVAQIKPYQGYPLVCTYSDGFVCNWVEFYVR